MQDASTTSDASDKILVAECVTGSQDAWIRLVHRYKRLIYSVTVRFGLDPEDRHDIFQAVCLETLKSLPSLRNAASLRYWIITITIRQCSILVKRESKERAQESGEAVSAVQDPKADTMQIYLAAERGEMLREAMGELPQPCRSLLEMLFFAEEKTSYSQLGGLLGWSKDTIGSARLRCLEKLRRILENKGF
jgi:RNA polymerase sigma factor (sigma-70 family)